MGKLPATIIIARHGARLDAADKNWHLTSPTPYDPPLSYGGWMQARSLGARIITLLQSMGENDASATDDSSAANNPPSFASPGAKRKRKLIIHSSPYLRCLQTSIAISSGISQYYAENESTSGSHTSTTTHTNSGTLSEPTATVLEPPSSSMAAYSDPRCLLRVDAFLGEWLCPEYFEEITPPPKSERLIAAAKAELLRRGDNVIPEADIMQQPVSTTGYFPGGWGLGRPLAVHAEDESEDASRKAAPESKHAERPPPRNRAGSYDTLQSADSPRTQRMLTKINTNLPPIPDGTYMPPTPSYAISRSNAIPAGYVAHARDACMRIDYPWDSMRDPLDWGNGGEYGEEWGTMHNRFQTGLERMLSWYQEQDGTSRPRRHSQHGGFYEESDDQAETVLILVTHGAGCNAIIGALSGEPAFVDIGTASLTLAVRKEPEAAAAPAGLSGGPVGSEPSAESSPLQQYNLQVVANTEHLRRGAVPPTSALSSPSSLISPVGSSGRFRFPHRASMSQSSFIIGPSSTSGPGGRGWTMTRPSTAPRGSGGLWGSMSPSSDTTEEIIPNFGDAWGASTLPSTNGISKGVKPEETVPPPNALPQRTVSQRGLWGGSPLAKGTDSGVKRRWTVTERRV